MDIVLATINAKYSHCAHGIRSIFANMGSLRSRTTFLEFTSADRTDQMAERLLAHAPRIIGLSVYIWNRQALTALARYLRVAAPRTILVLGGPELSPDNPGLLEQAAHHLILGEGEEAFPLLCTELLEGGTPQATIIAPPVDLDRLTLPESFYSDEDIAHRTIYVETSRGCPFSCHFCLSALDTVVRRFPEDLVLASLDRLWDRGVRHFKFLDRDITFGFAERLLARFQSRNSDHFLLHFELNPRCVSPGLIEALNRMPRGSVQLEIGVQTLDEEVSRRIGRPQSAADTLAALHRLVPLESCHIHADLIVGLPGDTLESIADSFDGLSGAGVQEIQVGMLKRLNGALIMRHAKAFDLRFDPSPPYEIISTAQIPFQTMQRMRRFARYFDLIGNSGNFPRTLERLFHSGGESAEGSRFHRFWHFSEWLHERLGRTHAISVDALAESLYHYLIDHSGDPDESSALLREDYHHAGRTKIPRFLQVGNISARRDSTAFDRRQRRHRGETLE